MKKQSRWKGSRKLAHLEHQRRKYEGRTQWSNSWVSKYYEHKKHMDAHGCSRNSTRKANIMEKQNTDDDFGRNPQYMYGGWILPMVIVSCSFWSLIMLAVYYLFLR